MDIRLIDYQSTSAAGLNIIELRQALATQTSGLRPNDLPGSTLNTWIGRVPAIDNIDLGEWHSRNNALAYLGLQQGTLLANIEALKSRFTAHRLGVIMGSSTSSIDRTETAYTDLDDEGLLKPAYQQAKVHNPHAPSLFVAHQTGITGPAVTINTACSSSAKVFASAARWLECGVVDAVLVGGVDTLCLSVLHGFDSLQLVSENPCRPFDAQRDGINLGEAAGYAILQRAQDVDGTQTNANNSIRNSARHNTTDTGIKLVGYGESSDAYHMSHPHPEGLGAKLAMQDALQRAHLTAADIDYINLHGTSSRANDAIEGALISDLFPRSTQCSSTKGWMGHTLGAAGITEALIAADALQTGLIPGSMNLTALDDDIDFAIQADNLQRDVQHVMSNSFGFGGNNCCLVFSKVEAHHAR